MVRKYRYNIVWRILIRICLILSMLSGCRLSVDPYAGAPQWLHTILQFPFYYWIAGAAFCITMESFFSKPGVVVSPEAVDMEQYGRFPFSAMESAGMYVSWWQPSVWENKHVHVNHLFIKQKDGTIKEVIDVNPMQCIYGISRYVPTNAGMVLVYQIFFGSFWLMLYGFMLYMFHGGFQTLPMKFLAVVFTVIIGLFIIINILGFIGRQSIMKEFESEKYISTGRKLVFTIRLFLLVFLLSGVILFIYIACLRGY